MKEKKSCIYCVHCGLYSADFSHAHCSLHHLHVSSNRAKNCKDYVDEQLIIDFELIRGNKNG